MNLLLRFQRLLFIQLFEEIKTFSGNNGLSVEEGDLQGKLSLLKKYLSLLSHHVSDVMPLAISYGSEGPAQYVHACGILQKDVIGHLLPGKSFRLLMLSNAEQLILNNATLSNVAANQC